MELVALAVQFKDSFIEAVREYQSEPATVSTQRYRDLNITALESSFEKFIDAERSHAIGKNQPDGYVPQTELWLIDHDEYIGHVGIRHYLNEHLRRIGGHIGYDIRPSKRGRGYGNSILRLALRSARELSIDKVLLTCDETNIASKKIIEHCGGVFENKIPNLDTGVDKLRYWINLSSVS